MKLKEFKQKLETNMKCLIFVAFTLLQFSCNNDSSSENLSLLSSRLLAFEGAGSELKIVEVNQISGLPVSTFVDFEPMQASIDFDFTYFGTTNELFIRKNVYESGLEPQIVKVNIYTKEERVISSENYDRIIAGKDQLFGLERIVTNGELKSINLVEINVENASKISTMEVFDALSDAPSNNKTGISDIIFSYDTNEIIVPRRTSFVLNAIDDLIKIDPISGTKRIVPINHYEAVTIGRNGRLFAIKKIYNLNSGDLTFFGVVEVNMDNGEEINTLKEFDNSIYYSDPEIIFLGESNEILIDLGILYKINVDSKEESILSNSSGFYNYRSINIY